MKTLLQARPLVGAHIASLFAVLGRANEDNGRAVARVTIETPTEGG